MRQEAQRAERANGLPPEIRADVAQESAERNTNRRESENAREARDNWERHNHYNEDGPNKGAAWKEEPTTHQRREAARSEQAAPKVVYHLPASKIR